ncbi:MAG: tRNA preQ1(34) S-adenosylmethionine ribosyltransferase-isomerase QueA [Nitrospirota bacterium]
MKTADFDFVLPKELIALTPEEKRDHSRLLVLHRNGGRGAVTEHKRFFDIINYLGKGDMLLLNDTKVFPARLIGRKPSGGSVDMLLVRETPEKGAWEVLCRGGYEGSVTVFDGVRAELRSEREGPDREQPPRRLLRFSGYDPMTFMDLLWRYGHMPLPPYIRRAPDEEDKRRYQTVYAEREGSIAAPTAGLHFTGELLARLRARGVMVRAVTLHVGPGTFKPVKAELLQDHSMDPEYFEIDLSLVSEIERVKSSGGRLVTVGTTATRAIEGLMSGCYESRDGSHASPRGTMCGVTDIFIYPGYTFRAVDALVTNFHLPRSTPLMLVSAFSSFENIKKAYGEAVAGGYRFFSYGDAMLIL